MHLYASTHKVHSVDTLHSDALAFLRIQAHSDAFTHTRIQGECRPPKGLAQLQDACMLTRVCILTHSYAFSHTLTHSSAFRCINSHTQSGRVQTSQGAGSAPRLVHAHSCMHSYASWSMYHAIIAVRGACSSVVNWNTNLCTWMHHS